MTHKAKTMTNWDRLEFHSCSGSTENLKELYEGIKLKPTCAAQIKRPQKENNPPACFFFCFFLLLREGRWPVLPKETIQLRNTCRVVTLSHSCKNNKNFNTSVCVSSD